MQIVKNYREDPALRASFNALAEKTFGISFENWYQIGFWGDAYTPYSVVEDGQVVANVSVNKTDMMVGGQRRCLYQLGTVMTAEAYRNRGFIRAIMAEVEKGIRDGDGVYLYANDEVLEFYPKFGFAPGQEFVYSKPVDQEGGFQWQQIPMNSPENREKFRKAIESSCFRDGCHMVDNPGLIFFYAAQFLQDCVYHNQKLDTWIIAERKGESLLLHNVFSGAETTLEDVISTFGKEVREITLGFTPADPTNFLCQELKEEDSTFFVKGAFFDTFTEKKLRIPSLSHA